MPQPGRSWDSGESYRYGDNGMETDPEVKEASRLHYTTYFRQYDPRLGRWWSNDPVTHPWESPYAAMSNNPAALIDPLGAATSNPQQSDQGVTNPKKKKSQPPPTPNFSDIFHVWKLMPLPKREAVTGNKQSRSSAIQAATVAARSEEEITPWTAFRDLFFGPPADEPVKEDFKYAIGDPLLDFMAESSLNTLNTVRNASKKRQVHGFAFTVSTFTAKSLLVQTASLKTPE